MNYSTDIKFSNNLVKNENTTITYSGSLFRTGSEEVSIVYGFGDNWENTTEKPMTKNETNFSVEIELLNFDKLNFCFKNSNNIWDNNNYLNYVAPLTEPEKEYDFIINENIIDNMLNNLFETDLSSLDKKEEISVQVEPQETTSNMELEENSVVSEETFELNIDKDDPVDIQEFLGEETVEQNLTTDLNTSLSEAEENKKEDIVNFDMDEILNEILSPISQAQEATTQDYDVNIDLAEPLEENIFTELFDTNEVQEESFLEEFSNDSSVEEVNKESSNNEETSLVELPNENSFLVSPRSLSKFYMFKKKIKLAVYKFFTAIPKIIEASFNTEKN